MIAATLLGGCIPPGANAPPESANPPAPSAPKGNPPPLELDLSGLRDKPAWEMRPVVANARTENGQRVHIVAPGETGIAIARAYGIPWNEIVSANSLVEPYVIRAGQRLILPGSAATTPESRAAAFRIGIDDLVTGSEPARTTVVVPPDRPTTALTGPGRFVWPASGALTARFGTQGSGRFNQGIDIAATPGTSVRAASGGTVAYVGSGVPGYGGLILIRHDGGWISAYGRVSRTAVKKDDVVKAGDAIGRTGDDALHFELRRQRVPVDPVKYLPAR